MNRPNSSQRLRSKSLFRTALCHESLERRDLMAVTSQLLSGGILEISMDADRDSAQVNVRQGEITVQGSGTDRFDSARVNSIRVTSKSGDDQSILFQDGLAIAGNLSIADIDSVRFVTGEYSVGSASIVTQESIEFSSFQLRAAGNISLLARNRVTSTETGLLGFLGAVSQASASVRIVDSTLFGVQIDVLAQTSIDANANGDNSEDVQRDFARVRSVGNTEIVVAGRSNINATGNATLQADIVQNVLASAVALPDSTNAARDAALALTNVTSNAILTLTDTISIVASGDLSLLANNAVTITTTADGSLAGAGGKGGVVALAELNGRTAVNLGGSTTIRAANILSKALSTSTLSTTAKSTVGGATANDANTQADLQNNNAQTSAGGLSLAGAYARAARTTSSLKCLSPVPFHTHSYARCLDSSRCQRDGKYHCQRHGHQQHRRCGQRSRCGDCTGSILEYKGRVHCWRPHCASQHLECCGPFVEWREPHDDSNFGHGCQQRGRRRRVCIQ